MSVRLEDVDMPLRHGANATVVWSVVEKSSKFVAVKNRAGTVWAVGIAGWTWVRFQTLRAARKTARETILEEARKHCA
jgi:hypothetical protein